MCAFELYENRNDGPKLAVVEIVACAKLLHVYTVILGEDDSRLRQNFEKRLEFAMKIFLLCFQCPY